MKKKILMYPVVIGLVVICLVMALITTFNNNMYDLFSFHSQPVYFWQYFSGTFMHGSKEAPLWFLWVHLFMNCLMIIPFGCILEKKEKSWNTFFVFILAVILSSVTFQVLLGDKAETACGVSAVGYAFVAGGIMNMPGLWKSFSLPKKDIYIVLIILALIMLLPMITGWISTCLHIAGVISYFVVYFIRKIISKGALHTAKTT